MVVRGRALSGPGGVAEEGVGIASGEEEGEAGQVRAEGEEVVAGAADEASQRLGDRWRVRG
jgi:hypothetical protein